MINVLVQCLCVRQKMRAAGCFDALITQVGRAELIAGNEGTIGKSRLAESLESFAALVRHNAKIGIILASKFPWTPAAQDYDWVISTK